MAQRRTTTFEQALDRRLRHDPGQPLVTFYDDASGERTELSTTTYANWVAKTAGVLVEDLDLEPGAAVRVDLPTHWLTPVLLGAAWLAGMEVVGPDAQADLLVLAPAGLERGPDLGCERMLCALDPFAGPSREPLPTGVLDFGTLWPGQPDTYLGTRGLPGAAAYAGADWTHLLERAARVEVSPEDRVLSDLDPASTDGVLLFVATLVQDGSTIWVANPDPARWADRYDAERATRAVRE